MQKKQYLSVRQLANAYPAFTQSAIRWLIFNEKNNGFGMCIRRIGRKILIDLEQFEGWVDRQQ